MKKTRVLAAVVIVLALATPLLGQGRQVTLSVDLPDRPSAGARLFGQKKCGVCHSLEGRPGRIGPDLGRTMLSGTVLDLAVAFWNHAPIMRQKMRELHLQTPPVTADEMADLITFLAMYRYRASESGTAGDAKAGEQIFREKRCAGCHAADETAWGRLGPSLERYHGLLSPVFLAQAMWNHSPKMAAAMQKAGVPWPRFAGREMDDLVAYLQRGAPARADDREALDPGDPRRGRAVFAAKGCGSCHAIAGKGGSGGPDLGGREGELARPVAEIAGEMWNHSLGMGTEFARRGIERATLSAQETADLIAYLYFVNFANVRAVPGRGERLYASSCAPCHPLERARTVAPNLAAVPRLTDPVAIIAAMWNHAPDMEQELQKRGKPWPHLQAGDAGDLAAFLLAEQKAVSALK